MVVQFFTYFFIGILTLWLSGAFLHIFRKNILQKISLFFIASGVALQMIFIIWLWQFLERPPFRTLAETRIWYAFFLSVIGVGLYLRWKIRWILWYCIVMATVFLTIDFLRPETFDKTLMPALQSVWFIPHVVVYIIGYALLSGATLLAIHGLFQLWRQKQISYHLQHADTLVYLGFAFLTFGLLFGAIWAKEAWGHYWTWDPKETWALITWLVYLIYIHIRYRHENNERLAFWLLIAGMLVIFICWFGIQYLASAQTSVHVYGT